MTSELFNSHANASTSALNTTFSSIMRGSKRIPLKLWAMILEERQILQRYEEHKFENAIFEKLRLSLTRLQESFTPSGGFLSVEWAPQDLALSKICEQIVVIMMALPPKSTNFEEDSSTSTYVTWQSRKKVGTCLPWFQDFEDIFTHRNVRRRSGDAEMEIWN